ncbi:hypothetical protein A2U01_0072277, partial [Trifolium medium]|nr:hypothetical protein [Trifolium medium]
VGIQSWFEILFLYLGSSAVKAYPNLSLVITCTVHPVTLFIACTVHARTVHEVALFSHAHCSLRYCSPSAYCSFAQSLERNASIYSFTVPICCRTLS